MDPAAALTNAYKTYLGRDPEAGIINWRLGQLGGRNLAVQLADIAASPEAMARRSAPAASGPTELQSAVASNNAAFQGLLNRQNAEQEGLFKNYETKLGSQEKLPVLYNRLQDELGIPELGRQAQVFKSQIFSTKDLLDRLEEDINSRTSGSLTTDSQRNRQLAYERNPLETQLARLGTGLAPVADMLTSAQGQVGTLLNLNVQQQNKELTPLEMRINATSDRFAREITGFTQQKQSELDALMDKIQRERQLSDRDWELAQQLAAEEREFSRQKQLVKADSGKYLNNGTSPEPTSAAPTNKTAYDWYGLGGGGSNMGFNLQPANLNLNQNVKSGGLRLG